MDIDSAQYGTSQHWPYCRQANCTGCIPPLTELPVRISTRSEDWAAPAREILRRRGAWRS